MISNNNKIIRQILLIGMISAIMGQVFINPFDSDFRFSLGIVAMVLMIIKFEEVPIQITCFVSALFIFFFRAGIDYFTVGSDVLHIISKHSPTIIYYLIVGFLISMIQVRKLRNQPILFIILIGFVDAFSNIIELTIRSELYTDQFEIILTSLLITGIIRSSITIFLSIGIQFYDVLLLRKEYKKNFITFLNLKSGMKAEIFYLKKSMDHIELAMEHSYNLYSSIKQTELEDLNEDMIKTLKTDLLDLSKDIHEIKKDNQRVISGFERMLPEYIDKESFELKEILDLIEENTKRYIKSIGKNINFSMNTKDSFELVEYTSFCAILNNLVNNAIDSIKENGDISVSIFLQNDILHIKVKDNGGGIKESDLDTIFNPGFSTKFDKSTGKMSTGIGLTHIKHIVENVFEGLVSVESVFGKGTIITVKIPIGNLLKEAI